MTGNYEVSAGLSVARPLDRRSRFARDEGAYQRLSANASITLRRWMEIGPAIGMECRHGGGLHIDANEWDVEFDNGEVVLSSRLATYIDFDKVHTGFYGSAVTELCDCGRDGLRIIPRKP